VDDHRAREAEFHRNWQPKLWLSLAGLILLAAYVIAFVAGNDNEVSVDFIFFAATTSLIWVILLSLVVGFVAGMLVSQLYARRAYASDASSDTPSPIDDGAS